ncbi:MAG: sensor histidine kinase [Eubacteriaceae bacterium]
MKKIQILRKKYLYLSLIIFLALFIPVAILWSSNHYGEIYNVPQIKAGILDLKGYGIDGNRIPLEGEWEYFPEEWIVTDNIEKTTSGELVELPLRPAYENNEVLDIEKATFASYRIKIINANPEIDLSVFYQNITGAWRLFINDQLVSSSGILSKSPEEVHVSRTVDKREYNFSQASNEDLVLEVSNANNVVLRMAPVLASIKSINDYDKSQLFSAGIFLGVYFIILLFLILGIFVSKERKALLSFLIIMLCIFVKVSTRLDYGIFSINFIENLIQYPIIRFLMEISIVFVPLIYIYVVEDLLKIPTEKRIKKQWMVSILIGITMILFLSASMLGIGSLTIAFWGLSFSTYAGVFIYLFYLYMLYGRDTAVILAGYLFLFIGYILDIFFTGGFIAYRMVFIFPMAVVIFLTFNVLVYMKQIAKLQSEALKLANIEALNREIEGRLMLAQIQPHFLYNSLTAIIMMIRKDPKKAEKALLKFAVFLRENMASLGNNNLITFDEALEHVKNYVAIEELRMGERLKMTYEINVNHFSLPTLTVQPIVENAIKYGPGKKTEGGTVLLKTYETEDAFVIEIKDDGNGFDVGILEGESKNSLGIRNVKMRLETMVNGKLEISSKINVGTCAKIMIPKEEK